LIEALQNAFRARFGGPFSLRRPAVDRQKAENRLIRISCGFRRPRRNGND